MMAKVAFIGLGHMGTPMARNLLAADFSLCVYDIVPEAVAALAELGAEAASTAAETVKGVDFVISMLPASEQAESLYLGDDGILAAMSPESIAIDCSTIAPSSARRIAAAARERGIRMLDAPVSGGVKAAEDGTLTFIVGGPVEVLNACRMALEFMGINFIHAGDSGAGQMAKLCNNQLLAVQMAATAEALQLGAAAGIDPGALSEIMKVSSGSNWALKVYNPYPGVMPGAPASRGYAGGFMVRHMVKDLSLAADAASEVGAKTPMGDAVRELYQELVSQDEDFWKHDFSLIQRLFTPEIPVGRGE